MLLRVCGLIFAGVFWGFCCGWVFAGGFSCFSLLFQEGSCCDIMLLRVCGLIFAGVFWGFCCGWVFAGGFSCFSLLFLFLCLFVYRGAYAFYKISLITY
jgi:hypothetical protein